ncbi:MAG: helix-turn-helix transcriptional regulator [Pseudonocardia sp.]|nr:helix-turn-helix transcriptional regulator [Pseudonocardia sp.]
MRADAGLSLAKLGAAAHIERSYVHNITTGRRWPTHAVAQGLDSALGAQGTLLKMWSRGQAERPEFVRRRDGRWSLDESQPWRADVSQGPALRSLPLEPATLDRPVLDWVIGNSPTPIPTDRSGQWVIDQDVHLAADMLALFRRLDHVHGAGHVRQRAVSYLATEANDLLSRPPADRSTEAALMGVAAGICEMIGYQAVDLGANGLAAHYYIAALRFAEASGDRAYGAHLIAANIAHLALHTGNPNDALRMVLAAQQNVHVAPSPAARSARHAIEARVYARLRNEKACTAALIKAESSLSQSDWEDEPAWIGYFTSANLADETAHCMHDLGHHAQTQHIARAAVIDLDPSRVRRMAIDTTLLATSLAESGQVEEACAVGREAISHASRTHSVRTRLRINDMRRALHRYSDHRDVIALESVVRDILQTDTAGLTVVG